MTAIVVPFRGAGAKRRLGPFGPALARAMLADVLAASEGLGDVVVARAEGGQGVAVAAALAGLPAGPVLVVNADLPCATRADLERLLVAAPALVEARDGTTNALALPEPGLFADLYGPGSAARFRVRLAAATLALPGLVDDVDTFADLERFEHRLGPQTRAVLDALREPTW